MKIIQLVGSLAAVCVSCTALAARGQPVNSQGSIQALLKSDRVLTRADVLRVQKASQSAMADQRFRVTLLPNAGGPSINYDLQMGSTGQPRYFRSTNRWSVAFDDYTGQRARSCGGAVLSEELVLSYTKVSAEQVKFLGATDRMWNNHVDDGSGARLKAGARTRESRMEMLDNVWEMLAIADGITIGPLTMVDGHPVRALMKHHELRPGDYSSDPIPPEVQDWLWIDVQSLFMTRWETMYAGVSDNYGYTFKHDPTLDMTPPHTLKAPTCVP